jgi:hypothetical protein
MGSASQVPDTRLLGEGELSADHIWRALRRYGGHGPVAVGQLTGIAPFLGIAFAAQLEDIRITGPDAARDRAPGTVREELLTEPER